MNLTKTDHRALEALSRYCAMSCSAMGEYLYHDRERSLPQQAYARPGGKVLWRLVRLGLAKPPKKYDTGNEFTITPEGERVRRKQC